MNTKKIVFLFRNMGMGGAQKIEAFVANTLFEAGHEIIAINMSSSPCTVNLDKNIKIIDVLYDAVENCENKVIINLYKFLYLIKLRKAILSLKPDLICAFLSDVARIVVLATKGCSIPVIASERGDPYAFTEKQFAKYRKTYTKCKAVVFQLEGVAKKYNLPNYVQQKVIPNPCILRKDDYSSRQYNTEHIIIGAGRFTEQKRFDVLIDAFEIVYKKFPQYRLHIYGDGPLGDQLALRIRRSSAYCAIKLITNVDDVFNVAKNAEFFVLSSDFEGIPNVLLEAMSCGMACISTDCNPGGARYLLKDGECGLIVPRGDYMQLATAMMEYIQKPDLRISNEQKGLYVLKDFSPQIIKNMWLDIFNAYL